MLEARELLQECITKGEQSSGYREFSGLAPGLLLLPDSEGYRIYIESLFDELSTEVKVLFDRRDPASALWPKRSTFEQLLESLNSPDLADIWGEDETIGWVYQFFNSKEERAALRDPKQGGSQAPRNSRELAVRNQFFTPRYVVQFLTDNTLGRIWYEMRDTKTALAEHCAYMVRTPGEDFAPRPKKDPRDLRVLDPACGSGHFLLYAFDLLLTIYEEAYLDPDSPASQATAWALATDYPSLGALRKAVPTLILAHNLHGVDIDPRCAQIAQLALWMRAQRAYRDLGVDRPDRSQIRRSNIVVAEPLVADDRIGANFVARLGDTELARVFIGLLDQLKLAGDLGLLLRIESLVAHETKRGQLDLFTLPEARIRTALAWFMADEGDRTSTRRRLFAEDAGQGVGLLSTAETRFDVVLMNPPFGQCTANAKSYLNAQNAPGRDDIGAAFIARGCELLIPDGLLGAISNRTYLAIQSLEGWRRRFLLGECSLSVLADLGYGVLDDAMVEAAAYVVSNTRRQSAAFFDVLQHQDKQRRLFQALLHHCEPDSADEYDLDVFRKFACAVVAHWLPPSLLQRATRMSTLGTSIGRSKAGFDTGDNFRFLRLHWEVFPESIGSKDARWALCNKGGEYAPYFEEPHLVVNWKALDHELGAVPGARVFNEEYCFRPGVVYPMRTTSDFSPRPLASNSAFNKGAQFIDVDEGLAAAFIALAYTRAFKILVEATYGGGDVSVSGSAARNYTVGVLEAVPVPPLTDAHQGMLEQCFRQAAHAVMEQRRLVETSLCFDVSVFSANAAMGELARKRISRDRTLLIAIGNAALVADNIARELYGFSEAELRQLWGPHPFSYGTRPLLDDEADRLAALVREFLAERWSPDDEAFTDSAFSGSRRVLTKKGYFSSRLVEMLSHMSGAHPETVLDVLEKVEDWQNATERTLAKETASVLLGIALGRWFPGNRTELTDDPFGPISVSVHIRHANGILHDDDSATGSLHKGIGNAIVKLAGSPESFRRDLAKALGDPDPRCDGWFATRCFDEHLSRYSASRRKAPIYWQLAVPSARYSVWLYLHAFSEDTFYKVQNNYVGTKLAHEERRLEALRHESGSSATAADRKEIAAQETFVDELRAFLDEVKRVAPLWKPNLDDGVIINFAPLWRLVPQHKPWQKEVKSTWDALCHGKYDWAHLAMHLWPERVVPKCAADRSLAIAHGLEEIFWVQGADGRWKRREIPTRSVIELVMERTSPAVKAALTSLLEAPAMSGGSRARGGRRRAAHTDLGGNH